MKKVSCPSCGKENRPDARTCAYCAMPIDDKSAPHVEPISPYDDLFSDDIIPEKPQPKAKPLKGPVLEPDADFEEPAGRKRMQIPLLANRDMAFLAGIIGVGIILILAVFFLPSTPPDQTSVQVPEITPEVTREIIETPKPTPDVQSGTGYTQFDNFSDKESGWGSYESDTFLKYYSGGEYHMIQKGEDLSDRALLGKDVTDFVAEVETRLDSGPLTGQYGMIFRFDNGNYYSFGINGRGWFTVRKHMDGKVYEMIPLTETYILNKGYETNRLGIKAEGNTLSLYINGKMVRAISDTSLTHGDIGFFVSRLAEQGFIKEQPVHVAFDNFKFGEI
jgi:hypothetical protein